MKAPHKSDELVEAWCLSSGGTVAQEEWFLALIPTMNEAHNAPLRAEGVTGTTVRLRAFVDKYFYFSMALLFIAIKLFAALQSSGAPTSYVEGDTPIHPAASRPWILWAHNIVFSAWFLFFLMQSTLVRAQRVKWCRIFGWFGAGLGLVMVPVGIATAVVKGREELAALWGLGAVANLLTRFFDVIAFGVFLALAVLYRKNPEFHRRFIFIATCGLLATAFTRFDFVLDHNLFFPLVDLVIILGVLRDFMVDRRVHKVYLTALPALLVVQVFVTFSWQYNSGWWLRIAHVILG